MDSEQDIWTRWRSNKLMKLIALSKDRPRDLRLKQRIKDFETATGDDIVRWGEIISREYGQVL